MVKKFLKYASITVLIFPLLLSTIACRKDNSSSGSSEVTVGGYDMNTGIDLQSAKFDVVSNGNTSYKIVISETASEAELFAAEELTSFIQQTTNAVISTVPDSEAPTDKFISIGRTSRLAALNIDFDYSSLNFDGFFIKTVGSNVYIDGYNDRGRLYGTYDFIERFLGVKFLTAEVTYVPNLENLSLHQMNIVEIPEFRYRNYYNQNFDKQPLFSARSRMYSTEAVADAKYGMEDEWYQNTIGGTIHTSIDYVPKTVYGESHPEFYASYTNPSVSPTVGDGYENICYTNGITADGEVNQNIDISVAKAALQSLKTFAESNPTAKFFNLGIGDLMDGYCMCNDCKKSEEDNGSKTATVVIFINAMAREMNKLFPEREINIVFFAYYWTEQAPVKRSDSGEVSAYNDMCKLEDNVHVRIAPIKSNGAYSLVDSRQLPNIRNLFKDWSVLTKNLMLFDYHSFFKNYFWYYPDLSYMADDIKAFSDMGTTFMLNLTSYNTVGDWQSDLKYYIASKLYWHADRNVQQLIEEYITCYYGEKAKPYVLKYIDIFENHFAYLRAEKNLSVNCVGSTSSYNVYENYPIRMLESAITEIENAQNEISKSSSLTAEQKAEYVKRLSGLLLTPQSMILTNYDSYYEEGKEQMAQEFLEICQTLNISIIGEHTTLSAFTDTYLS